MTMSVISTFKIDEKQVGASLNAPAPNIPLEDQLCGYIVLEITLDRKMLQPNELRFTLRRNVIEKNVETIRFNIASTILSKEVECTIETSLKGMKAGQASDHKVEFKGVVVSATLDDLDIHCVALSKDYEKTLVPHCNFFINKTLKEIVESIYTSDDRSVNPRYTAPIPYVVQYNETDYDFMVRLAKRYGEFFYYDYSTGLVFGKRAGKDPFELKRIDDFLNIQYEVNSGNPNHAYIANHYQNEGRVKSVLTDYSAQGNVLASYSKKASTALAGNALFYDYPNQLPYNADKNHLNTFGTLWNRSEESSFVICHCTTYRPDLHVGSIIQPVEDINGTINHGSFMVTSSHLTVDCNGSPVNEITAMAVGNVDLNTIFPPYYDVNAYPRSSAQRAIVYDNADPLKLGRVLVLFEWQLDNAYDIRGSEDERKKLPWIRIAQPYGGPNKGCYVLPEVGEEVMVGFEHENMEKPFVIGTLYNKVDSGSQAPCQEWAETQGDNGKNKNNEVKAFRTNKGHTIEIHDVDGQCGFIRIYNSTKDSKYYDVILSSDQIQVPKPQSNDKEDYKLRGPKTQDINPGKDIQEDDYVAQNLRLMVRSYGGDIVLDAGDGDLIINAKNIRVHATGDTTTLIDKKNIMKVNEGQFVDVKTNSLVVQEQQKIMVKGEDTEEYQNNVTVTSNETFTFKPQKVLDIGLEDNTNVTLKAKSLTSTTTGNTEIKADQATITAPKGLVVDGGTQAELKAANVTVNGQTKAEIKGVAIDIQGEESISEKATKIELTSPTGSLEGAWKWP